MTHGDARRYRDLVEAHGLSTTQRWTLDAVPHGAHVLELGCSTGYIGRVLRETKGCRVAAVEIDAEAAAEATRAGLEVHVGSLEDPLFVEGLSGPFDVVIATDVLEHLRDPAAALRHVRRWLGTGGCALVAVPNVAAWSMRVRLGLRGDFTYEETGLLDRTHLRFFTWETFHRLLRDEGWVIEDTVVDTWEVPGGESLLFDAPRALRARMEAGELAWMPSGARDWLFHAAGRMLDRHQRLGRALGTRFPNLCARHMGVKLRPG